MTKLATQFAQAGSRWDTGTGAVSMPVHRSTTFRHPGLGQSTGFDYSRTGNPTRAALEATLAGAEGGETASAFAFASGLAAIDAVLRLLEPGGRLVATEDLYGGTFRLVDKVYRGYGIETVFVNTADPVAVEAALDGPGVRCIFLEVPSNPLLKVADIRAVADLARSRGILTVVDNTFLTFCRQRPLDLGADAVVYSATKYLGGHDDVLGGAVIVRRQDLAEKIGFLQNAVGAVLAPDAAWLLLRGLKTLPLRLTRQEASAQILAEWLCRHPRVRQVYYPGLPEHPGHALTGRQSTGCGAMIAFEANDSDHVADIVSGVQVFMFAESLGGVASLITLPARQTHADIAPAARDRLGITDRLLRLSVGIESVDDLRDDLENVL